MRKASRLRLLTACGLLLTAGAATVAAPADVADLVGVKGRDGEAELQARGYEFHHAADTKDGKLTIWKNNAGKACLQVLTKDGRYATLEPAPPETCQDAQ